MVEKVTVSLPALVIALAVIILVILFWLFSRNTIRITSLLDDKQSLEQTVSSFADVIGKVMATCPVPDTTKGGSITRDTCPQLYALLDAIESSTLLDNDRIYFFLLDTQGNMVVNGGAPAIARTAKGSRPGNNVYDYVDPDGNRAVQSLLSKAASGGGYVEYKWPCPKSKQVGKKVSYVKPVPSSPWVLGAGLYF
jgi:signal transduction histidine kinase